jgi:hypothetical protein
MPPLTQIDGPTKAGSYIVVLKDHLNKPEFLDRHNLRGELTHEYSSHLVHGFAG